ncbi:MAG TPA: cellulase family glycosylhydrolase [Chitinophagales bacterium]|nr:cellulase family glycosylhydrolase [Chitinophagales bacterium]
MKPVLLFATLLVFISQGIKAQSLAQTRCDNFKQGVNLSNWLEAYWDGNWPEPNTYSKEFLINMKAAGINSVRMPVCFALVTADTAPYRVDTANRVFELIDSVISWTADLHMKLIIDNHHEWNITDGTWRTQLPRLEHLWAVLAQRYSYLDPNQYFFEILNEPNNISNDSLLLMYPPVIDTIRQYAPGQSIIVSPTNWSGGFGYYQYGHLADTNLIYTLHSYDPFNFTHQGLSWVNPPLTSGVPYPGSIYDVILPETWALAIQWRDSLQLPMFLGEFGVGIGADANSRCNWIDTLGKMIDEYHLSAFHWDVTGDFRIFYSGVPTQDSVIPCFKQAMHLYGDTVSGIRNNDDLTGISIYPNPNNGFFTCTNPDNYETMVDIFDNTGRRIYNHTFSSRLLINGTSWAKGFYVVKITAQGASRFNKIVIE